MFVQRGVFGGLALALCSIVAGGVAFATGSTTVGYAAMTLGFGLAGGWGVTWVVYQFSVSRPLAQLAGDIEALAGTDAASACSRAPVAIASTDSVMCSMLALALFMASASLVAA